MLTHRLVHHTLVPTLVSSALVVYLGLLATACSGSESEPLLDAGATAKPPLALAASYALTSTFSLSAPPAHSAAILAELAAATDGPDDPSRYMIDRIVARIPEGGAQLAAAAVAPYLAAYVQARIDSYAPKLGEGLRALGDGMNRIARRFGTLDTLTVTASGDAAGAQHALVGFRVDGVEMPFAPIGLSDVTMPTSAVLDGERITFGEHAGPFPYGVLLRQGLDRAVIGTVVPGAADLDDALAMLVDCRRLGAHVADYIGVGSADIYAGACRTALVRLAAELYERIDVTPALLTISGSARVVDRNADGPGDVIVDGTWSGTLAGVPLTASSFDGNAR